MCANCQRAKLSHSTRMVYCAEIKFCVDLTYIHLLEKSLYVQKMLRAHQTSIEPQLESLTQFDERHNIFAATWPFEAAEATGFAQCPRVSTFKPRC